MVMLLVLISCGQSHRSQKPQVVVSIEPLRYFVEQIVGDKYQVTSLVPAGSSPETYEPTPAQMMAMSDSRVFLAFGTLQTEKVWTERISESVPQIAVALVADSIDYLREPDGSFDPHVWTSPRNARLIAANVCHAISALDTTNADYYKSNLTRLISRIERTDSMVHALLDGSMCRTFVIYHPALTYFAHEYGFIQIPIEKEGKEPTPELLKSIIVRAKSEKVRSVLVQKEFNESNASIIAGEIGAKVQTINPLSYDWDGQIIDIARKLK